MTETESRPPEEAVIFRGVNKDHDPSGVDGGPGRWWSESPYYALHHGRGGGDMGGVYVARVPLSELDAAHPGRLPDGVEVGVVDASIDAGYRNFIYVGEPPANARLVTDDEIARLNEMRGGPPPITDPNEIGYGMVYTPENAVQIGKFVFGIIDSLE